MATKARFDPSAQRRRTLLAKVHIAKKDLGLTDDRYGGVLLEETGNISAAACTEAELEKVLKAFGRMGFRARPAGGGAARPADHPSARKARALWIGLYQLGAIRNPSEQALEALARRQLHVEAMRWANQAQCDKLIEALKAMAERAGWPQSTRGARDPVSVLKRRLCEAILARMVDKQLVPANWSLSHAAWHLLGERPDDVHGTGFEMGTLDRIANGLADKLREAA